MPATVIKSFSKKTGKSEAELEKLWKRAKEAAEKEGRKDDYAYIMGIFKKMTGLKEVDVSLGKKYSLILKEGKFYLYTTPKTIMINNDSGVFVKDNDL